MQLTVTGTDGICGTRASVTTAVEGGVPPYAYIWSNDKIEPEILNLDDGTYTVTVSDANQCTLVGSADVINDETGLLTSSEMDDATCQGADDGSIEVTVTQGTAPFQFDWNTGDTTARIENLGPGRYSLSLTDFNGCTSFSIYQINEPAALSLDFNIARPGPPNLDNGSVIALVNGGVTPYSYLWSNGATSSQISQLEPGTYRLTVTGRQWLRDPGSGRIGTAYHFSRPTRTPDLLERVSQPGRRSATGGGGLQPAGRH